MNIIEGGKSDADRAAEIKAQVLEKLAPLLTALDAARAGGFNVEFNVAVGPLNKFAVTALKVSKEF